MNKNVLVIKKFDIYFFGGVICFDICYVVILSFDGSSWFIVIIFDV